MILEDFDPKLREKYEENMNQKIHSADDLQEGQEVFLLQVGNVTREVIDRIEWEETSFGTMRRIYFRYSGEQTKILDRVHSSFESDLGMGTNRLNALFRTEQDALAVRSHPVYRAFLEEHNKEMEIMNETLDEMMGDFGFEDY